MTDNAPWSFDLASFIIGLVAAGFLGNILQQMRNQRGLMKAPDRPMNVPTQGTPNSVIAIASAAFWRFIRLCIFFVISVIVIGAIVYLLMQR